MRRRNSDNVTQKGRPSSHQLSRREFIALAGRTALAAAAVPAIASLAGCGQTQANGDTIAIALDRTITTLDPAMHRSRTVEAVIRNVFDGLVTRDQDMKVVPQLAESWRVVDDNNWEFKLREGVKFHDGSPFTARDVKFTIDRIITPGAVAGDSSPRKGLLGDVDGAHAVDDYTVVIHTSRPFPALLSMLTFHEIVPKDYTEEVGDRVFAKEPIGTGPFKFGLWKRGERIVLKRFEDYYGGSPDIEPVGAAPMETVLFKPIPEAASRISALLAGEVQLIEKVPAHSVRTVETDKTQVLTAESTRTHYLGLNVVEGPFQNPRAREAISHAVDFSVIVEKVLSGYATVLAGPLVPAALGFDKELEPTKHDPHRAKTLLAQAEFPMDLLLEVDAEDADKEIAQVIADQLRGVGLNARARIWNWDLLNPALVKHKRNIFLTHWGNASLDPIGIIEPLFGTGGRGNYTGFSNRRVDDLLAKARTSFDEPERRAAYIEVQRILRDDIPAVFGLARKEIYGVSNAVANWQPKSDGMLNMHDVSIKR